MSWCGPQRGPSVAWWRDVWQTLCLKDGHSWAALPKSLFVSLHRVVGHVGHTGCGEPSSS